MRKEVEAWQRSELTDVTAKVVYAAFVEGKLEKLPGAAPTFSAAQDATQCSLKQLFRSLDESMSAPCDETVGPEQHRSVLGHTMTRLLTQVRLQSQLKVKHMGLEGDDPEASQASL